MEKKYTTKEEFWREHIREQQEIGLSIREYCELEELAVSTFGYWKNKLERTRQHKNFIEVKVPPIGSNTFIHIRLHGGTELGVAPGTDVRYVGELVKVLKQS